MSILILIVFSHLSAWFVGLKKFVMHQWCVTHKLSSHATFFFFLMPQEVLEEQDV